MSNIASALKEEISRISRKEIRRETAVLKKSSGIHRSEIAALKRRVLELERHLRRVSRAGEQSMPVAANGDSAPSGTRFSAKSMAAQRKRLGLSAAECGLLIGASAQSVHNWDEGKARPRAQHLPAIIALRKLGRRHANDPGEPQGRLRRRPWRGERRGSPETSLLKEDRRRTPPALRRAASARPVQSRRSLLATLSRRSMWQVVAPKADRR